MACLTLLVTEDPNAFRNGEKLMMTTNNYDHCMKTLN